MIALIEFYFLGKSLIMKLATLKPLQSFAHYNITFGMMNELKKLLEDNERDLVGKVYTGN